MSTLLRGILHCFFSFLFPESWGLLFQIDNSTVMYLRIIMYASCVFNSLQVLCFVLSPGTRWRFFPFFPDRTGSSQDNSRNRTLSWKWNPEGHQVNLSRTLISDASPSGEQHRLAYVRPLHLAQMDHQRNYQIFNVETVSIARAKRRVTTATPG